MNNEKLKGIILDYGGTLDAHGDHWSEIIFDCYQQSELFIDKEEFRKSYVTTERALAVKRYILPRHNFSDLMKIKIDLQLRDLEERGIINEVQHIQHAYDIAERCYNEAKNSIQSIRPTLDLLREHFALGLVSNFYGNIESVLLDMGIRDYFNSIIESAVVGVRKPNPAIFSLGVIAQGLQPNEIMVVGDSYKKDIQPALSLGCQAVWVKGRPWNGKDECNSANVPVISNLNELPQVLNR